jgi:hypothetical protein
MRSGGSWGDDTQGRHRICDFSSTHRTSAFSGGLVYRPTTSRTLLMDCGSVDSFGGTTEIMKEIIGRGLGL